MTWYSLGILSIILGIYLAFLKRRKITFAKCIILLLLIFSVPLCLNVSLLMGADRIYILMQYAWVMVVVLPIILLENMMVEKIVVLKSNLASVAVIVSVSMIIYHFIYVAQSTYLGTEIYMSRMEFKCGKITNDVLALDVDFSNLKIIMIDKYIDVGIANFQSNIVDGMRVGTYTYSFNQYINLYFNINFANMSQGFSVDGSYLELEEVQEMESYPNEGYIKKIGDVLVIKL